MEFRLTYAGKLLAMRNDKRVAERSLHVHDIRKEFHKQLKYLWSVHPILAKKQYAKMPVIGGQPFQEFNSEGFRWLPLVNEDNGLICALDILMLREGPPGAAVYDIDNRLKTIFDALRMARSPSELGENTSKGKQLPDADESPFFVLLQDDRLITHVAVTTDTILEPVPKVPPDDAARLVINVTVRPYDVHMDNLALT